MLCRYRYYRYTHITWGTGEGGTIGYFHRWMVFCNEHAYGLPCTHSACATLAQAHPSPRHMKTCYHDDTIRQGAPGLPLSVCGCKSLDIRSKEEASTTPHLPCAQSDQRLEARKLADRPADAAQQMAYALDPPSHPNRPLMMP